MAKKSWWQFLWEILFPPPLKPTPTPTPTPTPPPVVVEPPPPPPPPPEGRKTFWSAAVNRYMSSPLQGCIQDSINLTQYLSPKGFEIHHLHDEDVTGMTLESFWTRAVQETKAGDLTVLHFSGHGANGPSGLPDDPGQNIVTQDMRPFYASRIGRILAQADPGAKVVVLLDCCHSEKGTRFVGSADYRVPRSVPWSELDTTQDPLPLPVEHRRYNLTALARSEDYPIVEFAACQANDVTYDATINGVIQGCATRAWIDAATDLDAFEGHGLYTVYTYQKKVQTLLPNDEFPNRPQVQASAFQLDDRMWAP